MTVLKRGGILLLLLVCGGAQALAAFPFSFRKQELKTDYSQTVWDRMMRDQAVTDMRRGMYEMSLSRYKDAQNSFAKAVIKNSQDPLGYLLLGASLYWSGKVDDAMSEYKEALRIDPENAMAYQLLAIAYGWKGDIVTAQNYFLTANKLDPNKADTHMNLGSTYAVQKNWDKALDHFRKAVELEPRSPLYHYQLGTLYEAMGRDAQAETSFKKAISLFWQYEDAQLALGALYEKTDDDAAALKYFKKAVKTKPGDFVARLRYAALLARQGRQNDAREVLDGAFSIVQFKSDGLALNAVYRASGQDAQAFKNQIEKFKQSLSKISPAKDIEIEVALDYNPVTNPSDRQTDSGGMFEQAYQKFRAEGTLDSSGEKPMTFKRSFVLNSGDSAARQQQIDELASGLENAVSQGGGKYNINMSLQGRTMDFSAPNALTQTNQTAPRAAYDPRLVGNDMGLWVTGKTWLKFVDEVYPDLQDYAAAHPKENLPLLLLGLANLVVGDGAAAAEHFTRAQALAPADYLPALGLGTAAVIAGDDAQAQTHYQRALALEPKNKTARKNLELLRE